MKNRFFKFDSSQGFSLTFFLLYWFGLKVLGTARGEMLVLASYGYKH